jgi:thiamine pyrophosphate-dependent acetolactate synthase large subunit-like protein
MSKVESADLILKLYDLRRETVMREARNWMFTFNPTSPEDIEKTMMDPEVGGYLRMVLSYWDMAASLVIHEAIDAEMFNDTVGEHIGVFAKIEPFLTELREKWEMPDAFKNLEKVIMDREDGAERLRKTQEWMKSIQEKMAGDQASEAAA